jgi:hypothetical protein
MMYVAAGRGAAAAGAAATSPATSAAVKARMTQVLTGPNLPVAGATIDRRT